MRFYCCVNHEEKGPFPWIGLVTRSRMTITMTIILSLVLKKSQILKWNMTRCKGFFIFSGIQHQVALDMIHHAKLSPSQRSLVSVLQVTHIWWTICDHIIGFCVSTMTKNIQKEILAKEKKNKTQVKLSMCPSTWQYPDSTAIHNLLLCVVSFTFF